MQMSIIHFILLKIKIVIFFVFKILSGIQHEIFILTLNVSNFVICNFHKKAVIVNVTYSYQERDVVFFLVLVSNWRMALNSFFPF